MRLFAFDKWENGLWRKKWLTLSNDFAITACDCKAKREGATADIKGIIKSGEKVFILIHQQPCSGFMDIESLNAENSYGCYVMYVDGCGCAPIEGVHHWIYSAKRPIPSDQDLSYLRQEFLYLCGKLKDSSSEKGVVEAWRTFEWNPLAELLEVCSPLFLAPSLAKKLCPYIARIILEKDEVWKKCIVNDIDKTNNLQCFKNALIENRAEDAVALIQRDQKFLIELARGFL